MAVGAAGAASVAKTKQAREPAELARNKKCQNLKKSEMSKLR